MITSAYIVELKSFALSDSEYEGDLSQACFDPLASSIIPNEYT
jgi:hypothetical protein